MPITVIINCRGEIISRSGSSEKTELSAEDICEYHVNAYLHESFYQELNYIPEIPCGELIIQKVGCNVETRCSSCSYDVAEMAPEMRKITQRRIWSMGIRQPSNMYMTRLGSLNTHDCTNTDCTPQNNLSDRFVPSISKSTVKRNSSSTRSTRTGNRPGAMTPGGVGVDQKHGSYERYLNNKRGQLIRR